MCIVNQIYVAETQSAIPAAPWREFMQSVPLGSASRPGLWSYLQCDAELLAFQSSKGFRLRYGWRSVES